VPVAPRKCTEMLCGSSPPIRLIADDPVERSQFFVAVRSIAKPRLRSPVIAARVVCGSQPVASTRAASVAPLSFVSIATMSASFEPARGEPAGGGFSAVAVAELGLALPVSTGGCVSPASSSMPIASRPARVMIRLMGRPIVVSSFSSVLSSLKFAWNHRTHFEFYMYL
jgi:hypothetical protein